MEITKEGKLISVNAELDRVQREGLNDATNTIYFGLLQKIKADITKCFWLSIKPVKKCLFSRRNGYVGKRVLGYSICLRLFNIDIL